MSILLKSQIVITKEVSWLMAIIFLCNSIYLANHLQSHTLFLSIFMSSNPLLFLCHTSSLAVITTNFLHQIAMRTINPFQPLVIFFHRFSSFYAIRTNAQCSTSSSTLHCYIPKIFLPQTQSTLIAKT